MNSRLRKSLQLLPYVFTLVLGVELALVIEQNTRLRDQLAAFTSIGGPEFLQPGDSAATIAVKTIGGVDSSIVYPADGKSSLLFVLSPTCPHCEQNMDWWSFLVRNIDTALCRVVAISIYPSDQTRTFLESRQPNFTTVIGTDPRFSKLYKISSVPQTILIQSGGIVPNVLLALAFLLALTGGMVVMTEPAHTSMIGCCHCVCDCNNPDPGVPCKVPIIHVDSCNTRACGTTLINCGYGPGGFCQGK